MHGLESDPPEKWERGDALRCCGIDREGEFLDVEHVAIVAADAAEDPLREDAFRIGAAVGRERRRLERDRLELRLLDRLLVFG